ncbi:MAG: haloalkane dehalogenase [Actinomycetota bacterium]
MKTPLATLLAASLLFAACGDDSDTAAPSPDEETATAPLDDTEGTADEAPPEEAPPEEAEADEPVDEAPSDEEVEPEPVSEACDAEPTVRTTDGGVDFVRTPDACFSDLPGWDYEPNSVEIDGLRQAYVDEGPADGEVILLLHGQPSWSYLYREMIPVFADAGYRVIAMDHLGMGRSDKPLDIESYSYLGHGDRLEAFIAELGLTDINLFVQDWGSLIGLRVAGENTELFSTITVGNGNLPVVPEGAIPFSAVADPDEINDLESPFADIPEQQFPFYDGCELIQTGESNLFGEWMTYSMTAEGYTASSVVEALTWFDLAPEVEAAYDAPFPSRAYMAGTRVFPSLVLEIDGVNDEAWAGLTSFDRPFLTLWGGNDAGTLGACETQQNLIDNVPGAEGQPHDRLPEAGHFLQSDQGTELATRMVGWLAGLDVGG